MKHPAAWCAAAAVVVLFACSSNNGNGFPFSGPSCPSQVGACFGCYEQNCNGSCLSSACADFFSCFCACNPGDQSCLQGCIPKAETQSCVQCASNVDQNSCQQACSSQCGGSSMGGSGGFGSSGSGGSGGGSPISCESTDGSMCMTFSGASTACPSSTTMVASCPSANELGACAVTATGSAGSSATVTEYYYCAGAFATSGASAAMFQMACTSASNSMWTPGSVSQCGDGGVTSSSSGGGSGSSSGISGSSSGSGGSGSSGSGGSSGGPGDGGPPICNSVPCGDAGQSMQYCEIDQNGACTQAWYQVGTQVFDCAGCSASGCMAAEQAAAAACP